MSRVQAPQFLVDVFRDLRDRRLLVPAMVLAVALVAVPVLLSSGGEEIAPPPPPVPIADEDATQVQSAVLAEQTGIRNYEKRLEALKSKNPFKQQFTSVPGSKGGGDAASEASAAAATTSVDSVLDALSGGGAPSGSTGAPVSSDGSGPAAIDAVAAEPETITEIKRIERLLTQRVSVTVGPLEDTRRVKHVGDLDLLRSGGTPLVAFLGASADGKSAGFLVSNFVVSNDGEGSCAGTEGTVRSCEFLTLKVGEQQFFHLADGSTHRLRVTAIREHEVKRSGK